MGKNQIGGAGCQALIALLEETIDDGQVAVPMLPDLGVVSVHVCDPHGEKIRFAEEVESALGFVAGARNLQIWNDTSNSGQQQQQPKSLEHSAVKVDMSVASSDQVMFASPAVERSHQTGPRELAPANIRNLHQDMWSLLEPQSLHSTWSQHAATSTLGVGTLPTTPAPPADPHGRPTLRYIGSPTRERTPSVAGTSSLNGRSALQQSVESLKVLREVDAPRDEGKQRDKYLSEWMARMDSRVDDMTKTIENLQHERVQDRECVEEVSNQLRAMQKKVDVTAHTVSDTLTRFEDTCRELAGNCVSARTFKDFATSQVQEVTLLRKQVTELFDICKKKSSDVRFLLEEMRCRGKLPYDLQPTIPENRPLSSARTVPDLHEPNVSTSLPRKQNDCERRSAIQTLTQTLSSSVAPRSPVMSMANVSIASSSGQGERPPRQKIKTSYPPDCWKKSLRSGSPARRTTHNNNQTNLQHRAQSAERYRSAPGTPNHQAGTPEFVLLTERYFLIN